jgi:hypothetical protein
MAYNCGCNCGCSYDDCGCQTSACSSCTSVPTTTTTTIPCDGTICDSSIDSNCVLNNNNNLICYGVNNGDNLNSILSILITKFTTVKCP